MRVEVGLLFAPNTRRLFAEIDSVGARALRNGRQQIAAAEDKEVDNGHDRQEIDREACCNNAVGKERRVNIRKILYLYRDEVEQQHLHIREQRGVGEEHREVHILRRQVECKAGDEIKDEAIQHRQDNAGEKVNVELRRTPILLQRCADEVIEIKRDERKYTAAGRVENKRDKPPYLPAQDKRGVKGEVAQKRWVHRTDKPEYDIGNHDVFHQIGYAEIRVLIAETIYPCSGVLHQILILSAPKNGADFFHGV